MNCHDRRRRRAGPVCVCLTLLALTGCDWVDSTGRQGNSAPDSVIALDDGSVPDAVRLDELDTLRLSVSGQDADGDIRSVRWSAEPVVQGGLPVCESVVGFSAELAADTLEAACSSDARDAGACQFDFEELPVDAESAVPGVLQYEVLAPELSAPVGLVYELTTTDNEGGAGVNQYTFCLVPINDPPVANADAYTVLEGSRLVVAGGPGGLLSNDRDDEDVRNEALMVLPQPATPPAAASVFELQADGGFTYAFSGTRLTTEIIDGFEYRVSDGEHVSTASVTLRIVPRDDPPEVVASIPSLVFIVGIPFETDLSNLFADPEEGTLTLTVPNRQLPPSGDIELMPDGVLEGVADDDDVGRYVLTISASDGQSTATANVPLQVVSNARVEADTIPRQQATVGQRINISVGPFFSDPEAQRLRYRLDVDDDDDKLNLTINSGTGVINGFVESAGSYFVEVEASDGVSEPTTARFEIRASEPATLNPIPSTPPPVISPTPAPVVQNRPPVFTVGSVFNQGVLLGRPITPVRPVFTDPDGDSLRYSITGNTLPGGVTINALTGVVSGVPAQRLWTQNLRVRALDSAGNSTLSNTFWIRVR